MPDDLTPASTPLTVQVALPLALDAEAYSSRINREPGWRAQSPAETRPWDVRLSDRCRVEDSGLQGPGDQGPTVVIAGPEGPSSQRSGCACCWAVPRGAAWQSLLRALTEAAGRPPAVADKNGLSRLTQREIDVLRLVGLGKTVNECAVELGVAPSTVGNHKYRLMRKLQVSTSLQLLRIAVSNGLAELE